MSDSENDGHSSLRVKPRDLLAGRIISAHPPEFSRHPDAVAFHIPHRAALAHRPQSPVSLQTREELKRKPQHHLEPLRPRKCVPVAPGERGKDMYGEVQESVDLKELVQKFMTGQQPGFLYLVHAVPPCSKHFTPYTLRVVPFKKLDRMNYLTMSAAGVTRVRPDETTFTPLAEWQEDYDKYLQLMQIKTFASFRTWKALWVWRKKVTWGKFAWSRGALSRGLFLLDPALRKAVLGTVAAVHGLAGLTLANTTHDQGTLLAHFLHAQESRRAEVRDSLSQLRAVVKALVGAACLAALLSRGFTPDDSNILPGQRMTYTQRANKRRFCARLTSFVQLCDLMVQTLLHGVLRRSLQDLHQQLGRHFRTLSSTELLEPQSPLFYVDVLLSSEGVFLEPPREAFMDAISQLFASWEDVVVGVDTLLGDPAFDPISEPVIAGRQEERLSGHGPDLTAVLGQDERLATLRAAIVRYLAENFDFAEAYIQRFQFIQDFFGENLARSPDTITGETDLGSLRYLASQFHEQIRAVEAAPVEHHLGILVLRLQTFKDTALPVSRRLLNLVENTLPAIGRAKMDSLLVETRDAQAFLDAEPRTVEEFVGYVDFVDKAQAMVAYFERELEYLKLLYEIVDEFHMECPPEDLATFQAYGGMLASFHTFVEQKYLERTKVLKKLEEEVNRDFAVLTQKIGSIQEDAVEEWLLDPASNPEDVKATLNVLLETLADCHKQAMAFREYQKTYKLEVLRLDALDAVMADVRLRKLLWDSLEEWDRLRSSWTDGSFHGLDPGDMGQHVARMLKNISQLERGLPVNHVVPQLRSSVEFMKDQLPVVWTLRNPALRPRHWTLVEHVLHHKFTPEEPLTLRLLRDMGAFAHLAQLQEVSAQASSEAALEAILKKVEDSWVSLELPVQRHKDSKDVYVLGSLEEVQQNLDDSNINLLSIISSPHLGPVKHRVDQWLARLRLLHLTLDAWVSCQQNWMYLESIFTAPDIQRQLPREAKMFLVVDKSFKDIMRRTAKMPLALESCTAPGLLEELQRNNSLLEDIMKCLDAYLESKRIIFPRFYFLSNDELIEILAQTRNPLAVQPHLRKCFDAIASLEFGTYGAEEPAAADVDEEDALVEEQEGEETAEVARPAAGGRPGLDILAMVSPEGERVPLVRGLRARGNVEDWLGKVQEGMFSTLHRRMQAAIKDHGDAPRSRWILRHPSQIVLTVSQIVWCSSVHHIFQLPTEEERLSAMADFETRNYDDLNELAGLVRGRLRKLQRLVLCALITVDVHARDIVTTLVKERVHSEDNFEWLKQLRYYWDDEKAECTAHMSSACHAYGYEYLGASPRLVITPLTDKCYLCLMGALQLDLGGAPAGPAGTGKTETTKDLAKSMAVQCVVFNCSEGLDYKMMGRFFSGLAQSGAWCCFDEFNRIDIEVLSVIAQQLITIRNAKVAKLDRFMFEGRDIKLVHSCAAFITMNPGYAGRTELPDNLKALFRPVSMMVPDYALIAEVILYSEGFESSKVLAHKMVQMYKLCSEQLSQQDHYDFGMRAVKSVLVMAGSLKRENPLVPEDVVLIRALRDSNLPKFLVDDAVLFQGILTDLFPGVVIPERDYGHLQEAIVAVMQQRRLQPEQCLVSRVIQLHETLVVRHGVMLVGPTGGGKTTVLNVLKDTLTKLHADSVRGPHYRPVNMCVLNPKSVTMAELYGEVNPLTLEWRDGLLGIMVRRAVQAAEDDHQWVVCDGPVDAAWIENMNTVLDDNKMLCLANSERIKLTPRVRMLFEVEHLAQASPATVSRCGMVYVDPAELKWMPYVKSWLAQLKTDMPDEMKAYILLHFQSYVEDGLVFVRKNCPSAIDQVDVGKAAMMCSLVESLLSIAQLDWKFDVGRLKTTLAQLFVFCYLWSLAGNLDDVYRERVETFIRAQFADHHHTRLPDVELWSLYLDPATKVLVPWDRMVPAFKYDAAVPFFDMLVPTADTVRYGYLLERLLHVRKPVLYTGPTGVGKSVTAKQVLGRLSVTGPYLPLTINFSAQTSSARTQEVLESRLDRRRRTLMAPPANKKLVFFVDDVNMPRLDAYGSQPPIELLRQYLDFGGVYDRDKLFWKYVVDVVVMAACAPPGGGRSPLTHRFVRHFAVVHICSPSTASLRVMFQAILKGFLNDFTPAIRGVADAMVRAAVQVYQRVSQDLLPTPAKSHYIFNLRDLSNCIQGVLQADAGTMREKDDILRLFYHECLRVFHDRLVSPEDKAYLNTLLQGVCTQEFGHPVLLQEDVGPAGPPLLFGDFMNPAVPREDRLYEEIRNLDRLRDVLQGYLEDLNLLSSRDTRLIFFVDAMEHVTRLARVLRAERGNGLLVGVGGTGRQSLGRLASHLCGYKCFQIELTRSYTHASFHEDLRGLYLDAGAQDQNSTFLFSDTQIVSEDFLEDINNILSSGDVPNLFDKDEYEQVISAMRKPAADVGIDENNRDAIFELFIARVRRRLHLVICMSPVAEDFRRRCRMFPSLVNCCTIDWFSEWPREALLSVARDSLKELGEEQLTDSLAQACVFVHQSVGDMTARFYEETRRHYYTTPSSYLELLRLYQDKLQLRRQSISKKRDRMHNGLQKLEETNELVDRMEEEVRQLRPQLQRESDATEQLLKSLTKDQALADQARSVVAAEEAVAKAKAEETQLLKDEAERDLALVAPALEAANKALQALNKADINELKVFPTPPNLVKFVMEAVCLLFGVKTDWASAKLLLGDPNFLRNLQEFDKTQVSDATLKSLRAYVDHPDFLPDVVARQSKVCRSICIWVRAIAEYAKAFRIVQPKRLVVQRAEEQLRKVLAELKEKQQRLASVERHIAELEASYDGKMARMTQLSKELELVSRRLARAGQLTSALRSEQKLWRSTVQELDEDLRTTSGDVLIGAASVAYLGAFTSGYRDELVELWLANNSRLNIPSSKKFSLLKVLADSLELRQWYEHGLPRDRVSTENGIFVMRAGKWPLMIDPQGQANHWVRQMEARNQLKVVKLTDVNLSRLLEASVRQGTPVLVQEVGEFLDPSLTPLLLRQIFTEGGRLQIRLGDSNVEYNQAFKLYMTTKLANPHYLPEVCILVTLVNFTVTPPGLEDQLLSEVVRLDEPQLERQRYEVVTAINRDKSELESIEDNILHMLFTTEGNILDDELLVNALNDSVVTAEGIEERLVDAERTEEKISEAREKYRVVASRGSVLFFVVADLASIDTMYQFSLKYFNQVFNAVAEASERSEDQQVRLATLVEETTKAVYVSVSRGLFERHKTVFSFMMCAAILRQRGEVSQSEWAFLLRGPSATVQSVLPKPKMAGLTDSTWRAVCYLDGNYECFAGLAADLNTRIHLQIGDFEQLVDLSPAESMGPSSVDWDTRLSPFQKLMLLKALQEEKLTFAITKFVKLNLGQVFVECPPASLPDLYEDMRTVTPLVFVLSTGSDPLGALQRFAADTGFQERLYCISLGQGQGPVAEEMVKDGAQHGLWVFLQNCHLATSWMPAMEELILSLSEAPDKIHPHFRLFMSSMPSRHFPVSVLQNSVKVTNEPPRGLRANMRRAFADIPQDLFEDHRLGGDWRCMVFNLCFFHAVVQERNKFGSLGWNIMYEFSDSDRECALAMLAMLCVGDRVPWDALTYIIGVITYGGRVTDYWDQRCLTTVLQRFLGAHTLRPGYKFSESGVYRCPESALGDSTLQQYRQFIEQLPILDGPEIFGMHENANIVFQTRESQRMMASVLEVQPSVCGGAEGQVSDKVVMDVAEGIISRLPQQISTEDVSPALMKVDSKGRLGSLTTVLLQEVDRYNRLLGLVHSSLADLQRAIEGTLVMSESLEQVFGACLNNQVPCLWSTVSYLSLKSLAGWTRDLLLRLDFVSSWLHRGPPVSFWLPGLFFTQGFLTGTLQTHARKYGLPIDQLQFDFVLKDVVVDQSSVHAKHLAFNKECCKDPEFYEGLTPPVDGVLVHGLFLDAARWDFDLMMLADQRPGEMNPCLPAMLLLPRTSVNNRLKRYACPLYKTAERAGVLSTTGHSTNFVVAVLLPTSKDQSHWVLRGTALLTQITD